MEMRRYGGKSASGEAAETLRSFGGVFKSLQTSINKGFSVTGGGSGGFSAIFFIFYCFLFIFFIKNKIKKPSAFSAALVP